MSMSLKGQHKNHILSWKCRLNNVFVYMRLWPAKCKGFQLKQEKSTSISNTVSTEADINKKLKDPHFGFILMDSKQAKKASVVELLERLEEGLVSDEELKKLVHVQLEKRLQWGYKPTHQEQLAFHLDFIKSLKQMDIAGDMEMMNSESYELPISFLKTMFGKTLKQSACYFESESVTIDEAEIAMNALHCERARLKDGQRILDIGCGQGSLIFHIANKYKNCLLTGITNSCTQKTYIEEQCKNLKLSNIKVILADVTKYETEDKFDRIVIIEALEHMKNIELFLKRTSKWMKEDGLLFVDHVCHKVFPDKFEVRKLKAHLISKIPIGRQSGEFQLPRNLMRRIGTLNTYSPKDDVSVIDHWIINGKNMARSHEEWMKNLVKNVDVAKDILKVAMGSEEAAERCIIHCRNFHLSMSELFSYQNGEEWMVSHVLFKKR